MRKATIPGSVIPRFEVVNGKRVITKYIARIVEGKKWITDPKTGRQKEVRNEKSWTFTGKDAEKAAHKKLEEHHLQKLQGKTVTEEVTLGSFLETAMRDIFKPSLRPSTYSLYDGLIRNHINGLKSVKLTELTVSNVEALWKGKMVTVTKKVPVEKDGKMTFEKKDFTEPMSRATKDHLRRFMINVLNHAMRLGKVKENVAKNTKVHDAAPAKTIKYLKAAQAKALLDKVDNQTFKAIFATQLMLGLRIGEALGIKRSDIEGDVLHVRQQIQRNRETKQLVAQELKTDKSKRKVHVPAKLLEMYKALPENSKEWLFATKNGTPIEPRNAQRALYNAAREAGLEDVSTHVLRHTYATLSVGQGGHINVISNALGHTHLKTTMIYAEAELEPIKAMNEKLAELF